MILHAYYTVNYQNPLYLNLLGLLSSTSYACNHFEMGVILQNKLQTKQTYLYAMICHEGCSPWNEIFSPSCHVLSFHSVLQNSMVQPNQDLFFHLVPDWWHTCYHQMSFSWKTTLQYKWINKNNWGFRCACRVLIKKKLSCLPTFPMETLNSV